MSGFVVSLHWSTPSCTSEVECICFPGNYLHSRGRQWLPLVWGCGLWGLCHPQNVDTSWTQARVGMDWQWGHLGYRCPLMCWSALHSGFGYVPPVAMALWGASGSRLSPADLSSKYKEEATVYLALALSSSSRIRVYSGKMNTSGIAFQNVTYSHLQTQGPPFPITSDLETTFSYHFKPGGPPFSITAFVVWKARGLLNRNSVGIFALTSPKKGLCSFHLFSGVHSQRRQVYLHHGVS